jgi:hypothetical protein
MTILAENLADQQTESCPAAPFLLYWRFRPTHPWNLEQFSERPKAHNRFFNLLERGIEARFETTRESAARRRAPNRRSIPLGEAVS